MTMNDMETETAMDLASAHAYLMIAQRCVDNARIRLKYTDIMADRKLLDVYNVIDDLLDELHEETFKEK